jgi:hypothetical protein
MEMNRGRAESHLGRFTMDVLPKPVEQVTVADLSKYPVWEFVLDQEDKLGETHVRPVTSLPVRTLGNRVVGTRVRLHNGSERWAILGNVSLRSARHTNHFLGLSIEEHGQWFHLARYFDADYEQRGPGQLAAFLGLGIDEVFPITYDLTGVAVGLDEVVKGSIPIEAPQKLMDDELVNLNLENDGECGHD